MRIKIVGDNLASRTLKGYIEMSGYAVVDHIPTFTIVLNENDESDIIGVDGVDSELERHIVNSLEDVGLGKILLHREGGNRSESAIIINYPAGKDEETARAITRGLINTIKNNGSKSKGIKLISILLPFLVLLFGLTSQAHSQQFVFGRAWDRVNLAAVDPGDSPNQALRVNCITGCGTSATLEGAVIGASAPGSYALFRDLESGPNVYRAPIVDSEGRFFNHPQNEAHETFNFKSFDFDTAGGTDTRVAIGILLPKSGGAVLGGTSSDPLSINCISGCTAGGSFADSSAFSFGTTAVGLSAFVVDDVGINTVAENSAAAARMNTNRILYTDISKTLANTNALLVTGTGGTFPISGSIGNTSFIATQATGTNFHAVIDSGAVTVSDGAGALNTIVDSGTLIATQATGTNLHTVVDSGAITASGTVTANQGTAAAAANRWLVQLHDGTTAVNTIAATNAVKADLSSIAGTATPTGNGTAATSLRVTIASDSTGNTGVAQGSTTSGQLGELTQGAVLTANPTYTTAQTSPISLTTNGLLRVDPYSQRFTCALDNIAATLTQCQAVAGAGLRHWITSVIANSTTATAGTFAIRQGTGSNCGTGTAGLLPGASTSRTYVLPANTAAAFQFNSVSGVGAVAANAICAIGVATNTLNITISGYTAP